MVSRDHQTRNILSFLSLSANMSCEPLLECGLWTSNFLPGRQESRQTSDCCGVIVWCGEWREETVDWCRQISDLVSRSDRLRCGLTTEEEPQKY